MGINRLLIDNRNSGLQFITYHFGKVFVTHFADGNMSWFDTERPHIVILCTIKHKLQKYYLSNSKSTNLYIRIFTFKHRKI